MGRASNPLLKTVIADPAAWLANFHAHPILWAVPALGVASPLVAALGFRAGKEGLTFLASQLGVATIIATVGLSMFPILLPSSSNPNHSLAVFDFSSSRATLINMLVATVIFMPIILAYTAWVYRVLRGEGDVEEHRDRRRLGLLNEGNVHVVFHLGTRP